MPQLIRPDLKDRLKSCAAKLVRVGILGEDLLGPSSERNQSSSRPTFAHQTARLSWDQDC